MCGKGTWQGCMLFVKMMQSRHRAEQRELADYWLTAQHMKYSRRVCACHLYAL